MDSREKVPIYVPVKRKERREEQQRPVRELPPDWQQQPIPKRWMVR